MTTFAEPEVIEAEIVEETPEIILTPPEIVPEVSPDRAVDLHPVPADRQAFLAEKADKFIVELDALAPGSPEMDAKIAEISAVGRAEVVRASKVSNRMLERPSMALSAEGGTEKQARIHDTLSELRRAVTKFDPSSQEGKKLRKLLSLIPGNKVDSYFDKYTSAKDELKAIEDAVNHGADGLKKDTEDIEKERANLWKLMGELTENSVMLKALDEAVGARTLELESGNPTDAKRADVMRSEVQFAVSQRAQDLRTDLAVAIQGYLAMDVIRKGNIELVKAAERAVFTTLPTLRNAVVATQALEAQRQVLDQIDTITATTDKLLTSNSVMLRDQSAEIQQRAASSAIDRQTLEKAFDNMFEALDKIENFKVSHVEAMRENAELFRVQAERGEDFIKRSREQGDDE